MQFGIIRFIVMVTEKTPHLLNNKREFIIKLPFASGGVVRDKSSIKYGVGIEGVAEAISQFMRNHPYVLGFIHYLIVQPRFPNNSEAKVITIVNNKLCYQFCDDLVALIFLMYRLFASMV